MRLGNRLKWGLNGRQKISRLRVGNSARSIEILMAIAQAECSGAGRIFT